GHTDIYGRTWNQRLADCGYDPYWAQAGGESFANFQSASAAFDWMVNGGGPGHSGGVEAPVGYKCAGVGYASVGSSHMWVVVLAAYSRSGPCPDPISVTLPPTVVPPTASPTATATIPPPTPTEVIYRSFAPALAGDD
ncbi:MAG TPA: hypothetical protein VFK32_09510, partial [Tepidiformaceae bacterium]|nr:hypothetical protein [Tepidiformaceae bacterium]